VQTGAIDNLPIPLVWLAVAGLALLGAEVGFQVGRWWRRRSEGDPPDVGGEIAGAALALFAFYLAFMVSFTVQRFDGRRALVMDEANAIGTTWLRAGYLAEPTGSEVRAILVDYTAARLTLPDDAQRAAALVRSNELLAALWAETEALVEADPDSESVGLFVETVNDTIDDGAKRQVAIETWRVPETMWFAALFMAFASMGLLGFAAGMRGARNAVALVVLVLVFSAVITLIVDLDRPYDGILTINQQALVELQQQIGSP
jgi:hypothetical protein